MFVRAPSTSAINACLQGKDYQSETMTEGEKTGIIIGAVVSVLITAGSAEYPYIQPMIQQYLPH